MLRGLIFSPEGRASTPGWTGKGPKQYRYYINTDAIKLGKEACEVRRVPANGLETAVGGQRWQGGLAVVPDRVDGRRRQEDAFEGRPQRWL